MNQKLKNFWHVKEKPKSSKGIYFFALMAVMAIIFSNHNVQAKALLRAKKTLRVLQSPSSLIQLRHKRDTFANQQQQQQKQNTDESSVDSDYVDENYDVLPDASVSSQPPTLADQISERAEQVAQSFKNMWQSLVDSVRHCIDAFRAMFGDDGFGEEQLTPEQEQQILADMEQQYRLKHEHDNEVGANLHANSL